MSQESADTLSHLNLEDIWSSVDLKLACMDCGKNPGLEEIQGETKLPIEKLSVRPRTCSLSIIRGKAKF